MAHGKELHGECNQETSTVSEVSSKEADQEKAPIEEELSKVKKDNEMLLLQLQRAQADFKNLKRRSENEKEELVTFALTDFIGQLLPVIDNFERAISAGENEGSISSFLEGINMVYRQLCDILQNEGVESIKAIGQPFDPFEHNAMASVETDEAPENTVLEEHVKGYKYKDKVVRHSLVTVAKALDEEKPQ